MFFYCFWLALCTVIACSVVTDAIDVIGARKIAPPAPSFKCSDHASKICKTKNSAEDIRDHSTMGECSSDICNDANNNTCPGSVHYQYSYRDNEYYDLVLHWDPINGSNTTVMILLNDDKLTCEKVAHSLSCSKVTLNETIGSLFYTAPYPRGTQIAFLFQLVSSTCRWPAVNIEAIAEVGDFDCNCENTQPRTPPTGLAVVPGPVTKISWNNSSSTSDYYLNLQTPSSTMLFLTNKNTVSITNASETGPYHVWVQSYSTTNCGCSNNSEIVEFNILLENSSTVSIETSPTSETTQSTVTSSLPAMISSLPPTMEHNAELVVAIPISVAVLTIILLVLFGVILLIKLIHKRHYKSKQVRQSDQQALKQHPSTSSAGSVSAPLSDIQSHQTHSVTSPTPPIMPKVALVLAPDSSDHDKDLVMAITAELAQRGVEGLRYDIASRFDQTQWLENASTSATAVLCVINQQFAGGWGRDPVQTSLQRLVQGELNFKQANEGSKFAVLFLRPSDIQHVPEGYFRSLKRFSFDGTMGSIDSLVRFISRIPEYQVDVNI